MKRWVLNGNVLEIEDDGERIVATAEQIYESVIERVAVLPDLATGKCGEAESIIFSRYPVDPFLTLYYDTSAGRPALTINARTQQGETFEISAEALAAKHVVNNGTWYPIAEHSARTLLGLMDEAGCSSPRLVPQTLRGLLKLKTAASAGDSVIDQLGGDALGSVLSTQGKVGGPQYIEAELYPYQREGWRWLGFIIREQLGGLLADEMGLGKTLQVISALRDPGGENRKGVALVIAPSSLVENWIRETEKFCPDFKAYKHQGDMRTGSPSELEAYDLVVTSYETVIRDLSLLKMIDWNVVILDEAQNIRNPAALRTKSVKELKRKVGFAVTGTPVENRLRDLWSIIDFAVPGYLGSLEEFESRYADGMESASELEPLISPLMLRRRISDVAKDLPERIDIPEFLEMTEAEASYYEATRQEVFEQHVETAQLVSLTKLRQFCAHPDILGGSNRRTVLAFSKLDRLKELLDEIFSKGEKTLIFTSYTRMADLIVEMTKQNFHVMASTLDGRLPIDERQHLIDRFTEYAGPAVLVLNPKAGGSGLNITAANHVIHYNPEWNPALEDQASGRAHRRGQQLPVTVRRLIYSGTVEEVIDERLQRKREIAEAAILGTDAREEDYADILSALQRSPLLRKKERP
jgi:SNF2 family DNA or RNA helicase